MSQARRILVTGGAGFIGSALARHFIADSDYEVLNVDTQTYSLVEASELVHVIQTRQNTQVACLEEIAFVNGFIDRYQLRRRGELFAKTAYGGYLLDLANEESTSVG